MQTLPCPGAPALADVDPSSRVAPCSQQRLHFALADLTRRRFSPALPGEGWADDARAELALTLAEGTWVEGERARIAREMTAVPTDPDGFLAWFEGLEPAGPGQHDPLFPWLAEHASLEAMRWFLRQEVAGEAGFDDLVAITQVKLPSGPKLELARNYWDELGRGHASAMHGPLLQKLAVALDVQKTAVEETVIEAIALGNLMTAFACNRRYAYQSIGALGVIELTAPARAAHVFRGLKRLGLGDVGHYFALHATLDIKHSRAWNAEVLRPLVMADASLARPLAEGAFLRLDRGHRCFERYRSELVAMGEATRDDFEISALGTRN